MSDLSRTRFVRTSLAAVALWPFLAALGHAGVVVLANRTHAPVEFTMAWPEGEVRRHTLAVDDVMPIPVGKQIDISFLSDGTPRRRTATANTLHHFVTRSGRLDLAWIQLPGAEKSTITPEKPNKRNTAVCVIPVKIFVDDDEPAAVKVWSQKLRGRFEEASDVFERACRTRFKIVAVGTWDSDDAVNDFPRSMTEFQREANPAPARLAVGFTSQYEVTKGRTHLGGTRGALSSHILIREWSQHVTPMERLEVLIHELGHFLGAGHSLQPTSVMRPTLGDSRAHDRSFKIAFDSMNAYAMCLVCEEVRSGNVMEINSLSELTPATRSRLRQVYTALVKLMPTDPVARHCISLLRQEAAGKVSPTARSASLSPETTATWSVVRAITAAAKQNHAAPAPLTGDRLTEFYVRRAATAADGLPRKVGKKAFLMALGITMDDTTTLRNAPLARTICRQADPEQNRTARLKVFGKPTMHARNDLAKHFFVSGALTALMGPFAAETVGISKEINDSKKGTGFSFVDVSANLAGVNFATQIYDGKLDLVTVARTFTVEGVLPGVDGLREGIAWKDFTAAYGTIEDSRFRNEISAIRQRIATLPQIQPSSQTPASPGPVSPRPSPLRGSPLRDSPQVPPPPGYSPLRPSQKTPAPGRLAPGKVAPERAPTDVPGEE